MIRIEGKLLVKQIRASRNGPFCIADLVTELGEFKVKDPLLDQFSEGEYQGTFWISQIYLHAYVSYGKAVTEIRARLDDVQVETEGRLTRRSEPPEPDPIDEVAPVPPAAPAPAGRRKLAAPTAPRPRGGRSGNSTGQDSDDGPTTHAARHPEESTTRDDGADDSADETLFGAELFELIQAQEPVKLDPTIGDRARFRAQTQRMHQLGYAFASKTQTWTHGG